MIGALRPPSPLLGATGYRSTYRSNATYLGDDPREYAGAYPRYTQVDCPRHERFLLPPYDLNRLSIPGRTALPYNRLPAYLLGMVTSMSERLAFPVHRF